MRFVFIFQIKESFFETQKSTNNLFQWINKFTFPLKTPRAGFEPATNRLTADRSTAELPRITTLRTYPCQLPKGK